MNYSDFFNHCISKPGVTVDYPFNAECGWFKVLDKLFALSNIKEMSFMNEVVGPFYFINLKCNPDVSNELRSMHDSIIPGWHMNKKHWISLILDGTITDDQIIALTDQSYNLVVNSLPKISRDQLKHL